MAITASSWRIHQRAVSFDGTKPALRALIFGLALLFSSGATPKASATDQAIFEDQRSGSTG
jgi:hypothetical protein